MTLANYQRSLCRLAFGMQLPDEQAAFVVYREMIRARFFGMARVAYRRSWALLGAAVCDASFARYLAAEPPSSPLVREVIASFLPFALRDEVLCAAAPFARDLLRFEAGKWCTSDAPSPAPPPLAEVDFEGVLVLNPTLSVLSLSYAVDDVAHAAPPACGAFALLIYRRVAEDDVHWYRATPMFGALLTRAQHGDYSFGVLLRDAFAACARAPDESLLTELAGELALAVERGVLLGVSASKAHESSRRNGT